MDGGVSAIDGVRARVLEYKAGLEAMYVKSTELADTTWRLAPMIDAVRNAGNTLNGDLARFPGDGRKLVRVIVRPDVNTLASVVANLPRTFAEVLVMKLGAVPIYLDGSTRVQPIDDHAMTPTVEFNLAIPGRKIPIENLTGITHLPEVLVYLLFAEKYWGDHAWASLTAEERGMINLILCPQKAALVGAN